MTKITGVRTEDHCPAPACGKELPTRRRGLPRLDLRSSTGLKLRLVFCRKACVKRWWKEWVTQETHECIRNVGW